MCEAWQRYARESSSGQLGEHNLYGAGVIAGAEGLLPPAMPDAYALDAREALDERKQLFCAGRPADFHGLTALEVTCATAYAQHMWSTLVCRARELGSSANGHAPQHLQAVRKLSCSPSAVSTVSAPHEVGAHLGSLKLCMADLQDK